MNIFPCHGLASGTTKGAPFYMDLPVGSRLVFLSCLWIIEDARLSGNRPRIISVDTLEPKPPFLKRSP
jgi:hypothetical protein